MFNESILEILLETARTQKAMAEELSELKKKVQHIGIALKCDNEEDEARLTELEILKEKAERLAQKNKDSELKIKGLEFQIYECHSDSDSDKIDSLTNFLGFYSSIVDKYKRRYEGGYDYDDYDD